MSYIIAITPATTAQDAAAWNWLETLRAQEGPHQEISPVLIKLHDVLTQMYPCLSSYSGNGNDSASCPWSDGPLINNFGHQIAVLGLCTNIDRVVRFIVARANEMNLTVFDEQTGTIYRPPPLSAGRELSAPAVPLQTLVKGQRTLLSKITDADHFSLGIAAQYPKFGWVNIWIDLACFGLDANGKLSDERYMTYFNQPQSPCGGVKIINITEDLIGFSLHLQRLPASIERLLFTASVDGEGSMALLESGYVRLLDEHGERARFSFASTDFPTERALLLAELYRKDGQWRFGVMGQGFNTGLEALLQYVGVSPAASTNSLATRLQRQGFGLRLQELNNDVIQQKILRLPIEMCTAFAARVALRMLPSLAQKQANAPSHTGFWYWDEKSRTSNLLAVFMANNVMLSIAFARLERYVFSDPEEAANAAAAYAASMAGAWAMSNGDFCASHAMAAAAGDYEDDNEADHAANAVCLATILAKSKADAISIAIVEEMNRDILTLIQGDVSLSAFLQQPIWSGKTPVDWQQQLLGLKADALKLNAGFEYWFDWFDHLCQGKPVQKNQLNLINTIPAAIQTQGAAQVNAWLSGLR